MDDSLTRFVSDLVGLLHGPMTFWFILQPLMAMIYATRDGLQDAREGKSPYFWTIFTRAAEREALLREGWKAVARIIVLGAIMDTIYQLIVFKEVHPVELIVIALLLAFVPYLLLRGPINRIASNRTIRKVRTG